MAIDERETTFLIGSDKVEGTAVYGTDGNKIGSIERVMIDKTSGRVSYAVLGFGGLLGLGNLAIPGVRHTAWRLCHRFHREPASGCPAVLNRERAQ